MFFSCFCHNFVDMASGGFKTPKSDVWGGVTALAIVKSGNCKKIKCNSCDKIFAGGSLCRRT